MPRTRRTPVPDAAATEDPAALGTPPETSDTPIQKSDDQTDTASPKPGRRRGTRTSKAEAAPAESAHPAAAEAPGSEESGTEAPKRRRGRRTGAAPESALEAAPPPAPIADVSAEPAKRRRGRRPNAETTSPVIPEAAPSPTPSPTPPSRRRGRARTSAAAEADAKAPLAQADAPLTDPIAQVAEGTPTEEVVPSRRRGRRQAAQAVPETPLTPPFPETEAPVQETGEETEDKRGRRSRRGRRRRGTEEPTTEMLEAAGSSLLPDEVPEMEFAEEEEDDTLFVYPPPAPPVYLAPPIVPPAMPPADISQAPQVTATVRHPKTGLARIVVGPQEHAPYFFFVNAETARDGETVEAQVREAAANGIHLFSGVMYLPLRNAYGDRSFGAIDALLQQILTADPEGFLLPRLQCVPTNYWARTHTDQMARYADGSEGDVSLASTEFWADCVDALEALLAHFADPSTPGGDRIIGFHLDRGEWFYDASAGYDLSPPNQIAFQNWLHAKYQQPYALRAAWHDATLTWEDAAVPDWPGQTVVAKKTDTPLYLSRREGRWPDYAQFSSELVADVISGLAAAIKTLSQERLLVAVSYGYTLEFAGRNDSGHLALGRLLQSPHIDIVAGPNSYAGRGVGSPAAFGAPIDSVNLHGKLWLVEDDTKTFLADTETDDDYNPKIVSGADTQAIHQRHFGAALAHKAGVTWMDLWGQGWLNSPDIWRELGGLVTQAERWAQVAQASVPDVAVLVDETSLTYLKNDPNGLGTHLIGRTRDLLLRAGGSVGFYLQSDITRADFPEAKLYLFLNALRLTTRERQAVREKLQTPGKTLAWLYAPGVFDENGEASEEVGEVVGMTLRAQPWNSRAGSQASEGRHPLTERMRGTKRIGQEEILNPLYAVSDPQATIIAEYTASGAASLAAREHKSGWKSVFFGDPYLTAELLRGLYQYAGVPVYETQDDIVYADGGGTLTIHGSFTGQRTVSLPRPASVYDVFDDKIIAVQARSFRAFLRARTTRLFLWGDGNALAAATGVELPAPSAEPESRPEARQEAPRVSQPPPLTPRGEAAQAEPLTIPGLDSETYLTLDMTLTDEEDSRDTNDDGSEPAEGDGADTPARRSRWQRRRAALRARKEAERLAKLPEGAPSLAASLPVDLEILLPGLPPRRTLAPDAGERVAGIVASDTGLHTEEIDETDSPEIKAPS